MRLLNNLEELNLKQFRTHIEYYINLIAKGEKSLVDALFELTEQEMELKRQRIISACVKTANFPFLKTLEDFDFSFQPSINKVQMMTFWRPLLE